MTQVEHTPLPYHAAYIGGQGWTIITAKNDIIAILGSDDLESGDCLEEDAAFIVRACNSHYDLLEALKAARHEMHELRAGKQLASGMAFNLVDEAIAKAERK